MHISVKVNPGGGGTQAAHRIMTGVHLTIQGTLTIAVLSDNNTLDTILTLQMIEKFIFWEGILTSTAHGKVRILTDKPVLHQNSLGQPGPLPPPPRTHFDRCITTIQTCWF